MRLKKESISVRVSNHTLNEFKKVAKAHFLEVFGFAIGNCYVGDIYEISFIWIPDDWQKYSTPYSFNPLDEWFKQAQKIAKKNKLQVLGTIHSHPIDENHKGAQYQCASPSETDWDHHIYYPLEGICAISRNRSGVLTARIRWWPQIRPVRTEIS